MYNMKSPDHITRRNLGRSRRFFSIVGIVIFMLIAVITIPTAVILTRSHDFHGSPLNVLVPLYVYPNPGAWEPLYDVLLTHPGLNFTLIINPQNGPGSSQFPQNEYISGVQKLNSYANVQTLGYVRTDYATRNISFVLQDVATYSGWYAFNATSLAMDGIFFDEIPSEFSEQKGEYLRTINAAAKNASGVQLGRTVIHNPGTIPDARFNDSNTDITVVYEGSYSGYLARQADLTSLSGDPSQYSYLLHSVPVNKDLKKSVYLMRQHAQFLFLTSLTENYYESFGSQWKRIVDLMTT